MLFCLQKGSTFDQQDFGGTPVDATARFIVLNGVDQLEEMMMDDAHQDLMGYPPDPTTHDQDDMDDVKDTNGNTHDAICDTEAISYNAQEAIIKNQEKTTLGFDCQSVAPELPMSIQIMVSSEVDAESNENGTNEPKQSKKKGGIRAFFRRFRNSMNWHSGIS